MLARVESEKSNVSNRLQYARNVLSHERVRLESGQPGLMPVGQVRELLRTMLAYGREDDRALAARICVLLQLDQNVLMGRPSTADSQVVQAGQQVLSYAIRAASMRAAKAGQVVPLDDDGALMGALQKPQAVQSGMPGQVAGAEAGILPLGMSYANGDGVISEDGTVRTSARLSGGAEELSHAAPFAVDGAGAYGQAAAGVWEQEQAAVVAGAHEQQQEAHTMDGYEVEGGMPLPGAFDDGHAQAAGTQPAEGVEARPVKKKGRKKKSMGTEDVLSYEGQEAQVPEAGWVPVAVYEEGPNVSGDNVTGDGARVVKRKKRSKKSVAGAVAEAVELQDSASA